MGNSFIPSIADSWEYGVKSEEEALMADMKPRGQWILDPATVAVLLSAIEVLMRLAKAVPEKSQVSEAGGSQNEPRCSQSLRDRDFNSKLALFSLPSIHATG